MVIAVNARFLLKDGLEGYGYFTKEVFSRIAKEYPRHRFYLLFDRPYEADFIFYPNCFPVVIGPPARHPLLWKYWYDVKVTLALKKIKADVFVSPDGFCSLTTKVPQCLIVHDLGFLHYPEGYKKSHVLFYKRYTPFFLKKAASIATVSLFSKKDIVDTYKIAEQKLDVVYSGVKNCFAPLPFEKQASIKEKYTEGKEYFIYAGAIHPRKNAISLLKAFSLFKKRQRSNMKLLLVGRMAWKNESFLQLLQTYKYRKDVVLLPYTEEEELALLIASAYALVYPSFFEGFGVPVLEAMKCGVPALASANSPMQEIGGEAALYFDPHDPADIGDKLMLIYKDETLRKNLIEKGLIVGNTFSWDRTAALLWQCILKAAQKH